MGAKFSKDERRDNLEDEMEVSDVQFESEPLQSSPTAESSSFDRNKSFSKRFRKSCRNWANQKGLIKKEKKIADEKQPEKENVHKFNAIITEGDKQPVGTNPVEESKEIDLGAVIADLVLEAQKKKIVSKMVVINDNPEKIKSNTLIQNIEAQLDLEDSKSTSEIQVVPFNEKYATSPSIKDTEEESELFTEIVKELKEEEEITERNIVDEENQAILKMDGIEQPGKDISLEILMNEDETHDNYKQEISSLVECGNQVDETITEKEPDITDLKEKYVENINSDVLENMIDILDEDIPWSEIGMKENSELNQIINLEVINECSLHVDIANYKSCNLSTPISNTQAANNIDSKLTNIPSPVTDNSVCVDNVTLEQSYEMNIAVKDTTFSHQVDDECTSENIIQCPKNESMNHITNSNEPEAHLTEFTIDEKKDEDTTAEINNDSTEEEDCNPNHNISNSAQKMLEDYIISVEVKNNQDDIEKEKSIETLEKEMLCQCTCKSLTNNEIDEPKIGMLYFEPDFDILEEEEQDIDLENDINAIDGEISKDTFDLATEFQKMENTKEEQSRPENKVCQEEGEVGYAHDEITQSFMITDKSEYNDGYETVESSISSIDSVDTVIQSSEYIFQSLEDMDSHSSMEFPISGYYQDINGASNKIYTNDDGVSSEGHKREIHFNKTNQDGFQSVVDRAETDEGKTSQEYLAETEEFGIAGLIVKTILDEIVLLLAEYRDKSLFSLDDDQPDDDKCQSLVDDVQCDGDKGLSLMYDIQSHDNKCQSLGDDVQWLSLVNDNQSDDEKCRSLVDDVHSDGDKGLSLVYDVQSHGDKCQSLGDDVQSHGDKCASLGDDVQPDSDKFLSLMDDVQFDGDNYLSFVDDVQCQPNMDNDKCLSLVDYVHSNGDKYPSLVGVVQSDDGKCHSDCDVIESDEDSEGGISTDEGIVATDDDEDWSNETEINAKTSENAKEIVC